MGSSTVFLTGTAGASPMPAVVVRPYASRGVVRTAPAAAPLDGTGLPFDGPSATVRLWVPVAGTTGAGASIELLPTGGFAAQHTSSTPGDLPPRDHMS